jgi:DNA invertase Pin-like site-specific DNA recombinase
MSKVAYLRVSAVDQNLDRQEEMFPAKECKHFVEKASEKTRASAIWGEDEGEKSP